ncbi:MAG: hypothetical protein R3F61_12630 [Myxococcota bacterium]
MSDARKWEGEFKRLFGRTLVGPEDDEFEDTKAELEDLGIEAPDVLVRFCASLDEGMDRLDLTGLGGQPTQDLCDGYGLAENNDPEEGTFGSLQAEGTIPKGLVMFGYGMTQLVWDAKGVLGAKGSIWQLDDMHTDGAKLLAPSLGDLLAGAQAASLD